MKVSPRLFRLLLALLPCLINPLPAQAFGWPNANDSIFPPQAVAKPFIDFDGKGFLIHGKRTFIAAGELQYSRTPRALWRDRMLRVKRAGYNALQTYVFWNFHEPREGQFDFSGDKDLDAYLKLAHSLGLYVVVRMGPYVNSEWDSGGLPVWLRFKPGLLPMQDNLPFYRAVDPYFAKLVPILAQNQINHGGAVIMVQMENENQVGGGTDIPTAYYRRFHDKMLHMGLQVPLFFSGLNHGDDPAGDSPFDTSQRTSPWYSTEFWTGWFGLYGSPPDRAAKLERATWKVIAYGGCGYSQYTLVGGTDFDAWNCDEQGASYDFCAPIGQTGDLRDVYYRMKRAAMFATSFPDVIENSLASEGGDGVTTTNGNVHITNRKGKAGEILFLDNRSGGPAATQIKMADGKVYPSDGPITLDANEIMPVVRGYPLTAGVTLTLAATRILGIATQGATTTLVIYGHPNEPAEMHFRADNGSIVSLKTKFPAGTPTDSLLRVGSSSCSHSRHEQRHGRPNLVFAGRQPDRLRAGLCRRGDGHRRCAAAGDGAARAGHRRPFPASASLPGKPCGVPRAHRTAERQAGLGDCPGSQQLAGEDLSLPLAQPGYNDADWKTSDQPLPMGADGDISADAWYRTKVNAPAAGTYQVNLSDAGDWVACFVNGQRAGSSDEVQQRFKDPVAAASDGDAEGRRKRAGLPDGA